MDIFYVTVYCPKCNKETTICLKGIESLQPLKEKFKALNIPYGNEIAFQGQTECICGKVIKATFIYE